MAHYNRSKEEWLSPFTDNSLPCKAGIRLVSAETKEVHCPFYVKWKNHTENSGTGACF